MRLTNHEITSIKQTIHELDSKAQIYLFGSRADDTKKGGDIDLLILSDKIENTLKTRIDIEIKICDLIGDQKIDIIVAKDKHDARPIVQIALINGVLM